MKAQILIILLIASMLLLGCTQEVANNDTNTNQPSDTNIVTEAQIVEQEINNEWINENETIDTGSVI